MEVRQGPNWGCSAKRKKIKLNAKAATGNPRYWQFIFHHFLLAITDTEIVVEGNLVMRSQSFPFSSQR
jgi:hypothetical protein